ncbi:multivesicular body subunit 12A isoform X1 [Cygnus olor]|uniref:multivesicular body subunit 12A isoform X1 n=1 Tax=Cygnus atratus TaxID=8868 RepID=UPI0015D5D8B6|nr:multivesicular body subunit 12A isoform X1 [Cygnus atratus]XP_040398477.1 multivesicular body subunit 12A isoform X1 [Cygnus olor]
MAAAAAEEPPAPLSGVGWAATPEAAPAGWSVLTTSVEGAAANLGKGFGHKGGGYLCVSTGGQAATGPVVTDVQVLSERNPQPTGYSRVPEFPEPRAGVSRKKRVYVRLQPLSAADTAVFDIKLSSKSKAIPHYMKIGELGGFAVWCKKGPVPKSSLAPVPSPRTVSLGLKQLSLQPAADSEQKAPERPLARSGTKRASFTLPNSVDDGSGIYNLSAMDGVPFTLHPKFESSLSFGSNALLAELNVKSLADIEKEYNYAFVVERTAAARLPPSIC